MNEQFNGMEAKMQADYDAIAKPFSESRQDMHWSELDEMVARVKPGSKVLDIGCGTGRLCAQLASKNVQYTGVDISQEQLNQAEQTCPTGEFWHATMTRLPFEDQSTDYVFMIASLHHVIGKDERKKAAAEAIRVLKPGGTLFVTVMGLWQKKYWPLFINKKKGLQTLPLHERGKVKAKDIFLPWSWQSEQTIYRYYHAFTKRELHNLFDQAPLSVYRSEYSKDGRKSAPWKAKNIVLQGQKMV